MNYKALVLDLDGTVYVDGKPIKDIVSKLNRLKQEGVSIIYLSNNTTVSRSVYYQKLRKLGLQVTDGEVVTPITIAGEYLKKKYKKGFIVGTESFKGELQEKFGMINDEDNPEFVLIAFDNELTYEKLRLASSHINNGTPYYITHIDLACPSENGPIPDCGAIALLIESVTRTKHQLDFGKPSDEMAAHIMNLLKDIEQNDILMAGDRLYTDIALGNKMKVKTLAVMTGETKPQDVKENTNPGFEPSHCSETLADFIDGSEIHIKG